MSLDTYFKEIDKALTHPLIREVHLRKEKRSDHVGLIVAKVTFIDNSELHVMEYSEVEKTIERKTYRYHYQNYRKEMIFRYDNAPHHIGISTYPHHKHIGAEIVENNSPNLSDVVSEIVRAIYRSM